MPKRRLDFTGSYWSEFRPFRVLSRQDSFRIYRSKSRATTGTFRSKEKLIRRMNLRSSSFAPSVKIIFKRPTYHCFVVVFLTSRNVMTFSPWC